MPRIRTIKPEFWSDEKLATVSETSLLVAIGLLNIADDEGYFNANPKLIDAFIFPLRESSVSIHGALVELSNIGYIEVFKCIKGEKDIGIVKNFNLHQVISRSTASKLAPLVGLPSDSLSTHGATSEDSTQERKGKERNKDMIDFPNQPALFGNEKEVKQDYLEERVLAFDDFWKQWSDNKKMVGKLNTAAKAKTKAKFINQTFPASKVRAMGIEAFNEEIESMLDLAWNAHSDIAKHDKTNTQSSWFNYRSMYPALFLSNAQWRDEA